MLFRSGLVLPQVKGSDNWSLDDDTSTDSGGEEAQWAHFSWSEGGWKRDANPLNPNNFCPLFRYVELVGFLPWLFVSNFVFIHLDPPISAFWKPF